MARGRASEHVRTPNLLVVLESERKSAKSVNQYSQKGTYKSIAHQTPASASALSVPSMFTTPDSLREQSSMKWLQELCRKFRLNCTYQNEGPIMQLDLTVWRLATNCKNTLGVWSIFIGHRRSTHDCHLAMRIRVTCDGNPQQRCINCAVVDVDSEDLQGLLPLASLSARRHQGCQCKGLAAGTWSRDTRDTRDTKAEEVEGCFFGNVQDYQ